MRIIAGSLRGRRLNPPQNLPVRPTTDMARESLFNILNNYVDYEDCSVLDLFSGTGAVSFEFVSRGAREVTSIDINAQCTDFVKSEAVRMGVKNLHVVRADVFDLLKRACPLCPTSSSVASCSPTTASSSSSTPASSPSKSTHTSGSTAPTARSTSHSSPTNWMNNQSPRGNHIK